MTLLCLMSCNGIDLDKRIFFYGLRLLDLQILFVIPYTHIHIVIWRSTYKQNSYCYLSFTPEPSSRTSHVGWDTARSKTLWDCIEIYLLQALKIQFNSITKRTLIIPETKKRYNSQHQPLVTTFLPVNVKTALT